MGIEMHSFTENNHLLGVTELSVNLSNSLSYFSKLSSTKWLPLSSSIPFLRLLPEGSKIKRYNLFQLMRDSSDEEEAGAGSFERAKSPPICGRSRSKSRERKLNKKSSVSQASLYFQAAQA